MRIWRKKNKVQLEPRTYPPRICMVCKTQISVDHCGEKKWYHIVPQSDDHQIIPNKAGQH